MDKFWLETKKIINKLSINGPIVAPIGFDWNCDFYYTYEEYYICENESCFIIHKGMIEEIYRYGIPLDKIIEKFNINFANKVFIILSDKSTTYNLKSEDIHLDLPRISEQKNISDPMLYSKIAISMENDVRIKDDRNFQVEYIYNLFCAGEFKIVNDKINEFETKNINLKYTIELCFRIKNYSKVINLILFNKNILIIKRNIEILILLTYSQIVLGKERTNFKDLKTLIKAHNSVNDNITVRIIDLAKIDSDTWDLIINIPEFNNFINSRYLPIDYINKVDIFNLKIINKKIDIVYSWFDSEDISWIKERKEHKRKYLINDEYDGKNRVIQSDEIYLSINLLIRNISQIRKIFIVSGTSDANFKYNKIHKLLVSKIVFINQNDILDSSIKKPCFNSDVIESQLHNIKNLLEDFIYLNDDYFITGKFQLNSLAENKYFFCERVFWKKIDFIQSNNLSIRDINTANFFKNIFGFIPSFIPSHQAYLCKKSVIKEINTIYKKEFQDNLYEYQFRQNLSIRFLSFYFWYSTHKGFQTPICLSAELEKNFIGLNSDQVEVCKDNKTLLLSINNLNNDCKTSFDELISFLNINSI